MYLRILHSEDTFSPINRVDILDRYLTESLRRPSDSFTGTFNHRNKFDLVAGFAKFMFERELQTFTDRIWYEFCDNYKGETLLEFLSRDILEELIACRVFARFGSAMFFRYRFFGSFFLGRALSQNAELLKDFVNDKLYLSGNDALDVVSSFLPNEPMIIEKLSDHLEDRLQEFSDSIAPSTFDPLVDAIWPVSDDEEEKLWTPVSKAIERGPKDSQEIDELRTSYLAEIRTEDQNLRIKRFQELEYTLFITHGALAEVFKNCSDVGRDRKLKAYELLLRTELAAFQVGTMFAPLLAKNKYYQWGGIAFIDFDVDKKVDPHSGEAIARVVTSLAESVAHKSSSELALLKMAGVFSARPRGASKLTFLDVINFAHIVSARGEKWNQYARNALDRADHAGYYLYVMLRVLLEQINSDVVRGYDREQLKELVALIRAKRGYVTMRPKPRQIKFYMDRMDQEERIAKARNDGGDEKRAEFP